MKLVGTVLVTHMCVDLYCFVVCRVKLAGTVLVTLIRMCRLALLFVVVLLFVG